VCKLIVALLWCQSPRKKPVSHFSSFAIEITQSTKLSQILAKTKTTPCGIN